MQNITSGGMNPMLGVGARNTRAEQVNPYRDQERSNFRCPIDDKYFEDIVKATYLRDETVYKFFADHASRDGQETLLPNDFARAMQVLNVNWTAVSTSNFFNQIDKILNRGQSGKLTATQIDEAVCLGCKSKL
jgi:hypothetical protein